MATRLGDQRSTVFGVFLACLMLAAWAATARAEPMTEKPFDGGYLGGFGGYMYSNVEFSVGEIAAFDAEENAWIAGLVAGYGTTNGWFYYGAEVFGGYSGERDLRVMQIGETIASAKVDRTILAGILLRLGARAFSERLLFYLATGFTAAYIEASAALNIPGQLSVSAWYPGVPVAVGVEYLVGDELAIRGQVDHTFYFETGDSSSVTIGQFDTTTFTVGFVWRPWN